MQRYKCKIAYDGAQFSGYQIQPNKRTVQAELEHALTKLHKGDSVNVVASGRTDAGVHAKGQVIHFDSLLMIPIDKWRIALNSLLPADISILLVEKVDSKFHARFDATHKEYRYVVHLADVRDPFKRFYAYEYFYPLDLTPIREASHYLIGCHDFTSFCSAKTEMENKVRELKEIEVSQVGSEVTFRFVGNGFLYNMVRILVGTLLQVGAGEIHPSKVKEILEKKDRIFAGRTAPPQGLYLWEVSYK